MNIYGASVYAQAPSNDQLPVIVISQENKQLNTENLNKGEQFYRFTIVVNIFAESQGDVARDNIAYYYEDVIHEILGNDWGLNLDYSVPTPNLDTNVFRIRMRFAGRIDIENKVVYRK